MKKLRTILQSRYLFKVLALIVIIVDLLITSFYSFHSVYSEDKRVFEGRVISFHIDGDKLSITLKKKKN